MYWSDSFKSRVLLNASKAYVMQLEKENELTRKVVGYIEKASYTKEQFANNKYEWSITVILEFGIMLYCALQLIIVKHIFNFLFHTVSQIFGCLRGLRIYWL